MQVFTRRVAAALLRTSSITVLSACGGGGGYNSAEGLAANVLTDLWEYTP
jgi:hypothetical protein